HRFIADVALLENGQEVASGTTALLMQDEQEIVLQPTSQAGEALIHNPIAVVLSIEDFLRDRPLDEVILNYSAFRIAKQDGDKREPIVLKGAGYLNLNTAFFYDLSQTVLKEAGSQYQL